MVVNERLKERFSIAFEKAKEVNEKMKMINSNGILTKNIEKIVSDLTNTNISISPMSFKKLPIDSQFLSKGEKTIGAMMSTSIIDGRKYAMIYINSDNNETIQRFSIVHELGHLVTEAPNYIVGDDFTLSTQVNSDITFIDNETLEEDDFLVNEQIANIFALLVLIPDEITVGKIAQEGCTELSQKYKVTKEAIMSRMILGLGDYE